MPINEKVTLCNSVTLWSRWSADFAYSVILRVHMDAYVREVDLTLFPVWDFCFDFLFLFNFMYYRNDFQMI